MTWRMRPLFFRSFSHRQSQWCVLVPSVHSTRRSVLGSFQYTGPEKRTNVPWKSMVGSDVLPINKNRSVLKKDEFVLFQGCEFSRERSEGFRRWGEKLISCPNSTTFEIFEQWKKPGCSRVYRGWHFLGIISINHEIRIPSLNNQDDSMESTGPRFFFDCGSFLTHPGWLKHDLRQLQGRGYVWSVLGWSQKALLRIYGTCLRYVFFFTTQVTPKGQFSRGILPRKAEAFRLRIYNIYDYIYNKLPDTPWVN